MNLYLMTGRFKLAGVIAASSIEGALLQVDLRGDDEKGKVTREESLKLYEVRVVELTAENLKRLLPVEKGYSFWTIVPSENF